MPSRRPARPSRRASSPAAAPRSLQAIPALDSLKLEGDEAIGVTILRRALEAPVRQIAENAGKEGSVVVSAVKDLPMGHGYDALNDDYGDMFAKGIVDAAKVTRSALQNAASIAGMVLTTETLVTDLPGEEGRGRRAWPRPRRRLLGDTRVSRGADLRTGTSPGRASDPGFSMGPAS